MARYLLAVERSAAAFGQQIQFQREFDDVAALARRCGADSDPVLRDRIARARIGQQTLRSYALYSLTGAGQPGAGTGADASVMKLLWSRWHKGLGELAMDVQGPRALLATGEAYDLDTSQRLFLFSRADTIYGGSDEIQLGIIASRALGLPREPGQRQDRA